MTRSGRKNRETLMSRKSLTPLTAVAGMWLLLPVVSLADFDGYAKLTMTSDYMFRGVSQTMSSPAIQGELGFEHSSGWYGYAWGTNVDYMPDYVPDDGARTEFNFGVGYWHAFNDNLAMTLEAVRLIYPGTNPGYDYDYTEWVGQLTYAERHGILIGYSSRVFGESEPGTFYAFNTGLPVTENVDLSLELGHYDLDAAYDESYGYAELALGGAFESFDWRVSYFTATDSAEELFFESTVDDRVVASLTFNF